MTGQGFPPHYRLHESREFDAVFKANTYRVSGPQILLLGIENHLEYSRLGMVVGKKSAAKSVQRSRIKRAIRESFRKLAIKMLTVTLTTVAWILLLSPAQVWPN
jgi:ribonuclease P protein component